MDRHIKYRLRLVLGEVNGEPIEACVIGRSWGNKPQAFKFACQYLSGHVVQIITSTVEEILPTETARGLPQGQK